MNKEQKKQLKELRCRNNALLSAFIETEKLTKLFPQETNFYRMLQLLSMYRVEIVNKISELEEEKESSE